MRFGTECPEGFLPIFSVETLEDAKSLLVRTCETNMNGEFVARELAEQQNFINLHAFGDRLRAAYEQMKTERIHVM